MFLDFRIRTRKSTFRYVYYVIVFSEVHVSHRDPYTLSLLNLNIPY